MAAEKNVSWLETAWEEFLAKHWDPVSGDPDAVVEYGKEELGEVLRKYDQSGQGEIRIFHSNMGNTRAVQKRNVRKLPLSRSRWILFHPPQPLQFVEPDDVCGHYGPEDLTEGMRAALHLVISGGTNPSEGTLLAVATHTGLVSSFYGLEGESALFTLGRQGLKGVHLRIGGRDINNEKAQIEIDGALEWANAAVIMELKSSYRQEAFDNNQVLLPLLKWRGLLPKKHVYGMVLLGEIVGGRLEFWVYDVVPDGGGALRMKVGKSGKYIIDPGDKE